MVSRQLQYNHVSAGFALGMINTDMTGDEPTLKLSKVNFDSAFWNAWRSWDYSSEYPALSRQAEFKGLCLAPYTFISSFTYRKRSPASPLYWEGTTIYCSSETFDHEESEDIASYINPAIPLKAWVELVDSVFSISPNDRP